jgi:hypothetical protein
MTHLFNVENLNWEKNHGDTEAKFTIRKLYIGCYNELISTKHVVVSPG